MMTEKKKRNGPSLRKAAEGKGNQTSRGKEEEQWTQIF